jgi:hypothetical protein
MFWVDLSLHHKTGITGSVTIDYRTIYGSSLGAYGGIRLMVTGVVNSTAAGTTQLGINWAGTWSPLVTFPASTYQNYAVEMLLFNQAVTGQQMLHSVPVYGTTLANVTGQAFTADTTVNQLLYLQAIMPDTATALDVQSIEGELFTMTAII